MTFFLENKTNIKIPGSYDSFGGYCSKHDKRREDISITIFFI